MPFDGTDFNLAACVIDSMIHNLSDPDHWTKGRMKEWGNGVDRFCLLGALKEAMMWERYACRPGRIKRALARAIIAQTDADRYPLSKFVSAICPSALIMEFNDDTATSHADMLAVLRNTRVPV